MQGISSKLFWISLLYFFSGIPFGFFYTFIPVYLRTQGADLVFIGLLSSAGIFWSLKPLWAPLVDRYGQKVNWLILSLMGMSITVFFLSLLEASSKLFWSFLFVLPFFSALYDTALDGFIIEFIAKEDLGKANGLRISAYRIALIFSGGLLVAISDYLSFRFLFFSLSLIMFLMALFLMFPTALRIKTIEAKRIGFFSQYLDPIRDLLKIEQILLLLLFIATYKIGDALLGGMVYPFWVDKGFSKTEIGIISGTFGVIFTILGSLVGGYYIKKIGIKEALLKMGLLQAFSNLGYTVVAHPEINRHWIYLASIVESFTGGLGTSAFLTFLTLLCKREFSSTHYAIFSMLFSLTLVFSRTLSGFGAKYLGYFYFFSLTFIVALLPLLLIPLIFKSGLQRRISEVE